jgi:sulfite exporter TauE/SafE
MTMRRRRIAVIEPVTLGAALIAGLLGSGHCVGMCGPLAAVAGASGNGHAVRHALVYNTARIISYCAIGALFGGLGYAIGSAADIARWSQIIRIAMSAVLLLIGLQLLLPRTRFNPFERVGARFWQRIAPFARRLKPGERTSHLFALGLLWGWLPCGLVYSLLALAAVSGSAASGAATMAAFGVGTLPAMIGIGISGRGLAALRRPAMRKVLGVALIVSGIWVAAMPASRLLAPDAMHHGTHMSDAASHEATPARAH